LHLVTATHAVHSILNVIDDPELAIRLLRQMSAGFLSLYVLQGRPSFEERQLGKSAPPEDHASTWQRLKEQGLQSDDEHVGKLVYSCWAHEQLCGYDPVFAQTAQETLKNIANPHSYIFEGVGYKK